jgi:hypothetical protein
MVRRHQCDFLFFDFLAHEVVLSALHLGTIHGNGCLIACVNKPALGHFNFSELLQVLLTLAAPSANDHAHHSKRHSGRTAILTLGFGQWHSAV